MLVMFGAMDITVLAVMFMLGVALPLYALGETAAARVSRISKQLPYTLDLIALMNGAGLHDPYLGAALPR